MKRGINPSEMAPPHMRGSTLRQGQPDGGQRGSPAYAGIDLTHRPQGGSGAGVRLSLAQTPWGSMAAHERPPLNEAEALALHAYTFVRGRGGAREINESFGPGLLARNWRLWWKCNARPLPSSPPMPGELSGG